MNLRDPNLPFNLTSFRALQDELRRMDAKPEPQQMAMPEEHARAWDQMAEEFQQKAAGIKGDPLLDGARQILKGIDSDEISNEEGWWETSEGAQFGAKKLAELEDFLRGQS